MPGRSPIVGPLLAASSCVTLGLGVSASALLTGYPLLGGQAVRYALGVVVLLLAAFVGRWRLPRPTLVETLVILLLAATGLVGFNLCMLAALRHAEPGAVGVVIGCVPVVLALIGPLLERRVPTGRVVFAALLATLGAAVVEGGGGATTLGIALAVGALAGEAAFSLLAAPILPRLGPVAVSLYTCTAAAVMFAAGSPLIEDVGALRSPTLPQAATIAFLGLAVTAGGFIAWYASLGRLGVERAGLFIGLVPIAALAGGPMLGTGTLAVPQVVGVALVTAGILIGVPASRRHDQAEVIAKAARPTSPPHPRTVALAAARPPRTPVAVGAKGAHPNGSAPRQAATIKRGVPAKAPAPASRNGTSPREALAAVRANGGVAVKEAAGGSHNGSAPRQAPAAVKANGSAAATAPAPAHPNGASSRQAPAPGSRNGASPRQLPTGAGGNGAGPRRRPVTPAAGVGESARPTGRGGRSERYRCGGLAPDGVAGGATVLAERLP